MTSEQIREKAFDLVKRRHYFDLYKFFCEDMKQAAQRQEFKNNYYKWLYACGEVGKTFPKEIDKTFPQAILCAHAKYNGEDKQSVKRHFGWDVDKVLRGKICKIAELMIQVMEAQ